MGSFKLQQGSLDVHSCVCIWAACGLGVHVCMCVLCEYSHMCTGVDLGVGCILVSMCMWMCSGCAHTCKGVHTHTQISFSLSLQALIIIGCQKPRAVDVLSVESPQTVPFTHRRAAQAEWTISGHGDHRASSGVTGLGWDPWVATVFGPCSYPIL